MSDRDRGTPTGSRRRSPRTAAARTAAAPPAAAAAAPARHRLSRVNSMDNAEMSDGEHAEEKEDAAPRRRTRSTVGKRARAPSPVRDGDEDDVGSDGGDDAAAEEEDGDGEDAPGDAAEVRMARWVERDAARRDRAKFPTGQYQTVGGPVGVSGMNRQRISQTNQANYGGQTLGRMPPYSQVREHLDYPEAHRAIYDPDFQPPAGLSQQQRMATALAVSLSNVSEGDKIRGIPKFIRGLARRHQADPATEHPLDPAVNPAAQEGGAERGRAFMAGDAGLTAAQRDAIDSHASASSADDDDYGARRLGLMTPIAAAAPSAAAAAPPRKAGRRRGKGGK